MDKKFFFSQLQSFWYKGSVGFFFFALIVLVVVLELIKLIMAMFLKTWATDFNLIGHEHDLNWQASIPLVVFPLPTRCLERFFLEKFIWQDCVLNLLTGYGNYPLRYPNTGCRGKQMG